MSTLSTLSTLSTSPVVPADTVPAAETRGARWRQRRRGVRGRRDPEAGQATAEYALILLGAAAVALLLIGWATTTDQVSRLFDFVIDQVIGRSR